MGRASQWRTGVAGRPMPGGRRCGPPGGIGAGTGRQPCKAGLYPSNYTLGGGGTGRPLRPYPPVRAAGRRTDHFERYYIESKPLERLSVPKA